MKNSQYYYLNYNLVKIIVFLGKIKQLCGALLFFLEKVTIVSCWTEEATFYRELRSLRVAWMIVSFCQLFQTGIV